MEIPNYDVMPTELISYFLENAKKSSLFFRMQSRLNNTSRAHSNIRELRFPAPLTYNYQSKLWQSIYTQQPFSEDRIPWYRGKIARPVRPILYDSIIFFVNSKYKTVALFPYSSNECSIVRSLDDANACHTAHFWCKKLCMPIELVNISYEGEATFDESIERCQGLCNINYVTIQSPKFRERCIISDAFARRCKDGNRYITVSLVDSVP